MDLKGFEIEDFHYIFRVYAKDVSSNELKTLVKTSTGHTLYVDEPVECGGRNEGPNPIELLLASLASCFIISLKIHTSRLNVAIDSIEVYVEGSFDIRGFLGIPDYPKGLEKVSLHAKVVSSERCSKVEEAIKRALDGWIVGSTLTRCGVLKLSIDLKCRED